MKTIYIVYTFLSKFIKCTYFHVKILYKSHVATNLLKNYIDYEKVYF